MKENFKEKIEEIIKEIVASNDEDAFEAIADVFVKEFMKDERTLADVGRSLCKAFLHDDVDEALVAACGYSMYGIMDLANVVSLDKEEKKEDVAAEFEALSDNLYREALAKNIAIYLFEDGTCNTTSGNWITYFDEIETRFQVILSDNRDFCNQIVVEMMKMYGEKIAEISVDNEAFDITYYLDFCPNAEDD